ncbi:putative superfamily II RNA helicase [Cafeteria roenbergensis virus]|uniref:Putative superfamily II RNA helicase n=1 Tax=Cafeteria roenbergensis virus (strain BV-PW1) TaxID=693272 RepID=E3T5F3_CROVB|nr:Holliday junction branch migration helicase [Cafeteria roenbergensis virus BV-PW1]ADO67416.1 putative superfamily II RNA helicase [Cafeteria roenbergensis virus BV-PW1]
MSNKFLIKCPSKYINKYESKYRQFSFELDHFQKYACEGIDNNENVFVAVATGSGKTVPAEYAIAKAMSENKKVVYISPIKALSNQKYKDFSEEISDIGIMTGDNKVNPGASLVIMTAEIFRNSLYRAKWKVPVTVDSYFFDPTQVKYVILDEIHYINDKDRGKVWEEILMLLPDNTQLTLLSATIDKPEILAGWIGLKQQKNTRLITQYHRPVPLKFYLQNEDKKVLVLDKYFHSDNYKNFKCDRYQDIYWINHSITMLEKEEKLPSIYFVLSKAKIDEYINKIVGNFLTYEETSEVKKIWRDYLFKYRNEYKFSTQFDDLYNLVCRGVAYHHSGIIPILKEIVEILYSKKLIKVLLATETFSVGVNMPTKTVVFTGLSKYDDCGRRFLRTDEFLQMAGRAGRRGIDTFGEVIILPLHSLPKEDDFKNIIMGNPLSLSSRLKLDYTWVLRNINYIQLNFDHKESNLIEELIKIAKNSFLERNSEFFISDTKKEIESLEKELNTYNISEKYEKQMLLCYLEIDKKQSQKKRKLALKKLESLKQHPEYNDFYKSHELKKLIRDKNIEIGFENEKLAIHFQKIINYLEKEGLIQNNILTSFGLAAKEMNEINPLIFSYMAFENYFDNITFPELCAFLSIFLECKNNNICLANLVLNDNETILLRTAEETMNYYADNEIKLINELPYQICQNYDITLEHYEIVKLWALGKSWQEIKLNYTNFEGNFCKLILRIHNLLREVKTIFSILEKNTLVEIIEQNEDSLIRELVQTESLYLF